VLLFLTLFFGLGGLDPNFQLIVTKPDNVPIVGLIFLLVFFTWYSMPRSGLERPAALRRVKARLKSRSPTVSGCGRPRLPPSSSR
jgi:hypothetical protein